MDMYAGLKNYGASGYLNTLLQVLFHIPGFRRLVYAAKTQNVANRNQSIPWALQKLFYQLETTRNGVVETTGLAQAFGWTAFDLKVQQHDIVEFFALFAERLSDAISRLPDSASPTAMFKFENENYISCLNVPVQSSRLEKAIFAAVPVERCSSLIEGLKEVTASERLDGDNKYRTDAHGLQDAIKGTSFASVPSVLVFQLKRFTFSFETFSMEKIYKKYEFPTELDMAPFLRSSEGVDALFDLYAVATHLGGSTSGGAYAALIRPGCSGDEWYRFNDASVEKITADAVETTFGDGSTRCAVAYVLVYVKRDKKGELFAEIQSSEIPDDIKQ